MIIAPTLTPMALRDQRTFRALLNCMARPGSVETLESHELESSARSPLGVLAHCLVDHEVTCFVSAVDSELAERLLRSTGSHMADVRTADFVFFSLGVDPDVLLNVKVGTDEFPDESATILIECEAVGQGTTVLQLRGPGVKAIRELRLEGLEATVIEAIQELNADYPLGIDVILVDQSGRITCLPRTCQLELLTAGVS